MIPGSLLALLTLLPTLQVSESDSERVRISWLPDLRAQSGERDVPEDLQAQQAHPFGVVVKIETGQELQRITDSHNNFGADRATLEHNLSVTGTYTDALVELDYWAPLSRDFVLRLSAGMGGEQLGSHFKIGADNPVLGDPAGFTEQDFNYGLAVTWDLGVVCRYQIAASPFDIEVSVDYRGGGDSEKDALNQDDFRYWRVRGGAFAAWKGSENIRIYGGLHYTHFQGKFKLNDMTTGQDFTLDLAYDQPVDLALGVELTSGPVWGVVELDVLGSLSLLVSAGVRF